MASTILDDAALAEIVAAMQTAGLSIFELDSPHGTVRLRLQEATPQVAPLPPAPALARCMAPAAGMLLLAHPMRDAVFAAAGACVHAGETIALIRTGLLLRPVTAPVGGVLRRWLAEDGDVVGYGAALADIAADTE